MKISFQLTLFGHTYMFKLHSMKTPTKPAVGYTSRIPNTICHVLFLDYDIVDELTLKEELEALISEFQIGSIYVLKSHENAFHCVCIDHFRLREVKEIIQASSCDLGFLIAPRYDVFRNWVLRASGKGDRDMPKYVFKIDSSFDGMRKQSTAHSILLKAMGVPVLVSNGDGNTVLKMETYLTAKRTEKVIK